MFTGPELSYLNGIVGAGPRTRLLVFCLRSLHGHGRGPRPDEADHDHPVLVGAIHHPPNCSWRNIHAVARSEINCILAVLAVLELRMSLHDVSKHVAVPVVMPPRCDPSRNPRLYHHCILSLEYYLPRNIESPFWFFEIGCRGDCNFVHVDRPIHERP